MKADDEEVVADRRRTRAALDSFILLLKLIFLYLSSPADSQSVEALLDSLPKLCFCKKTKFTKVHGVRALSTFYSMWLLLDHSYGESTQINWRWWRIQNVQATPWRLETTASGRFKFNIRIYIFENLTV